LRKGHSVEGDELASLCVVCDGSDVAE
jgi:hypothetical protein